MPRPANTNRAAASAVGSRRQAVQQELLQAMRVAILQRANRRGLIMADLRRRIRALGMTADGFFVGRNPTLKTLIKMTETVGCRPVIRLVKAHRR